jgi:geranylgeranyl diphosphate synthase, type II
LFTFALIEHLATNFLKNMDYLNHYHLLFTEYLLSNPMSRSPANLYEPADYILSLGGKRLRPVFVLIGCGLFDKSPEKALKAALAIEIFHNFTLLHDDIMDNADLRRGQPTVHKKYNANTAILTGDVMMIQAYQHLLDYDDPVLVKSVLDIFNKMAFEVCEGQQLDMDFETRSDVCIDEYIEMITLKTSVLLATAIQLGSIIGNASSSDQKHLYEFAKNFGIAFQLRDDILDTFGEASSVGKKIGGDIIQNKKTYLYLKALELSDSVEKTRLQDYYSGTISINDSDKIRDVTSIFKNVNVIEYANQVIEAYRDLAISHLQACNINGKSKDDLSTLINHLIFRNS